MHTFPEHRSSLYVQRVLQHYDKGGYTAYACDYRMLSVVISVRRQMYNLPYGCIDYMDQKGARQLSRVCATQAKYMYDYVVVGISHNLH